MPPSLALWKEVAAGEGGGRYPRREKRAEGRRVRAGPRTPNSSGWVSLPGRALIGLRPTTRPGASYRRPPTEGLDQNESARE